MKVQKRLRRKTFRPPRIQRFGDVTRLTRQQGPADAIIYKDL